MSEKQPTSPPTYQRASAPSPSEPGSRYPSEAPEIAKQKTPERQIVDPRYGDGMAILKASYMEDEMSDNLTDATEASRTFNNIMDVVARRMNTPKENLMLIAGDKLDALMEVALGLKEENRKLKERVKELEEEKNQSSSS